MKNLYKNTIQLLYISLLLIIVANCTKNSQTSKSKLINDSAYINNKLLEDHSYLEKIIDTPLEIESPEEIRKMLPKITVENTEDIKIEGNLLSNDEIEDWGKTEGNEDLNKNYLIIKNRENSFMAKLVSRNGTLLKNCKLLNPNQLEILSFKIPKIFYHYIKKKNEIENDIAFNDNFNYVKEIQNIAFLDVINCDVLIKNNNKIGPILNVFFNTNVDLVFPLLSYHNNKLFLYYKNENQVINNLECDFDGINKLNFSNLFDVPFRLKTNYKDFSTDASIQFLKNNSSWQRLRLDNSLEKSIFVRESNPISDSFKNLICKANLTDNLLDVEISTNKILI